MSLTEFASRIHCYAQRHGLGATLGRIGISLRRAVAGRGQVLFVCDLAACPPPILDRSNPAVLERKQAEGELNAHDLQRILGVWNPRLAQQRISERFSKGASVWLWKRNGQLAAFGWTLIGQTMERHALSPGPNDAHLFDFFVFPEYRGHRINPALVNQILVRLASEGRSRAFIEAAGWNAAQLASLRRTPFRPFARDANRGFLASSPVIRGGQGTETVR